MEYDVVKYFFSDQLFCFCEIFAKVIDFFQIFKAGPVQAQSSSKLFFYLCLFFAFGSVVLIVKLFLRIWEFLSNSFEIC